MLLITANGQIATRVFSNPSFESPATGCTSNWSQIPQSEFPGWRTTDTGTTRVTCGTSGGAITNPIEIWTNGFQSINAHLGVQYAEINANINGYLYQEVCMLQNESFSYSIWHHRRETSGTDTMRARITDTTGTLISETANLSSSNNSWNNFTGTLTNNGTAGTRRFGYVAISTATGDISVGNLIDDTSFSIRPLVDIKQFNASTILENGGTGNLEVYVNGTLRSSATVVLTKTGTATITSDYTVGTPSRGTASVNAAGNITLTLPAGDYDPNLSSGTNAGLITIPFTAVNDVVNDNNETAIYTVGTVTGGGGGTASLDLAASVSGWSAACSSAVSTATLTIREPSDLTIAKSHSGNFTVGNSGTYSFTVSNVGGTASAGTITVTDNLPAGLTVNGGAAISGFTLASGGSSWTCNAAALSGSPARQAITCTSSTAIAVSGTSVFSFAVNVGTNTAVGTNSITNTADVSGGGEANTSNDSSSDPTTVLPIITLSKTSNTSIGTFNFTVTNADTDLVTAGNQNTASITTATAGTAKTYDADSGTAGTQAIRINSIADVVITETVPSGWSLVSGSCTNGTTTWNLSGGSVTILGSQMNTGSGSITCGFTNSVPDLTITKSHSGSFTVGSNGTYSFSVGNSGTAASSGTITVTDVLPVGLTVNNGAAITGFTLASGSGSWSCNANALTGTPARQTITCTSSTAIAASGASVFSFAVNVGLGTAVGNNSITNTADVSGGGEANTTNNSSSDQTTVLSPNLTIAKTDSGASFTVGSTGTYQITVSNSGTAATSGTVTVTDTLPTGLSIADSTFTPSGTNGANWSCTAASNVITCTTKTGITIATSGSSVFTLTVNVGVSAPVGTNSLSNTANVSGGNEATANNGNNSGSDTTTVLSANLVIAKSHSGNFTRSSTGTYQVTVTNNGTAATSGTITVIDTLPTGLSIADSTFTPAGTNGANWSCTAASNVITCTTNTGITIATSATSVFSLTVNVASNAAASVTNSVTVSGGNEATANSGNNSATDPTSTIAAPPNIVLVKSCSTSANADCSSVAQLPGTDITYQIKFTNTGGQSAANLIIIDGIPANMDFKLGSAAVNIQTTGLTFTIEYSSDYDPFNPTLATWAYSPTTGGGGASAGYDRLVKAIRWRVTNGTLSNTSPNNEGIASFVTKIR